MKHLSPIKLMVENTQEYYRARTFWTKEPETCNWIMNAFEDGEVFYDIGACIGQYSLLASYLYPKMKIYSFEPHINNYKRLVDNVKLNNSKNITHMCIAVSDHEGIEKFCISNSNVGTTGSQIYHLEGSNLSYNIETTSVDKIVETIDFPNHIKIDVDGTECDIIKGMEQTLKDPRLKTVIVEFNERIDEMITMFTDNGFTKDNIFTRFAEMQKAFLYRDLNNNVTWIKKQPNVIFTRVI